MADKITRAFDKFVKAAEAHGHPNSFHLAHHWHSERGHRKWRWVLEERKPNGELVFHDELASPVARIKELQRSALSNAPES